MFRINRSSRNRQTTHQPQTVQDEQLHLLRGQSRGIRVVQYLLALFLFLGVGIVIQAAGAVSTKVGVVDHEREKDRKEVQRLTGEVEDLRSALRLTNGAFAKTLELFSDGPPTKDSVAALHQIEKTLEDQLNADRHKQPAKLRK